MPQIQAYQFKFDIFSPHLLTHDEIPTLYGPIRCRNIFSAPWLCHDARWQGY